jgi:hypothetical protein
MPRPRAHLGDSHNFGRRVTLRDGRVCKPRTLLWEWLLLAEESPLRQVLASAAERNGMRGAFEFLPTLQFQGPRVGTDGEVEHVRLTPLPDPTAVDGVARLPPERRRALAVIVGRSLALFTWLGVADLHWENLVLGVDAEGRTIFGPLDIEMILDDLSSPTETKLLPDADPAYAAICRHAAGVRRVLPYLGKPILPQDLVAVLAAYREMLALLEEESKALAVTLSDLPELREAPIRVCLRGTDEYVRARTEPIWPPLLDAEREQMSRGDIPYFFRLYGRQGIHYYEDESLTEVGRLPLRGDVPRLPPLLDLGRGLRAPSRKKLREEGLFTVLGAFDDPSLTGSHELDGLRITFAPRRLVVRLPGGEELESRRDLRAFVGSVYLPCECGEVRAVFVPQVTTCKPTRFRASPRTSSRASGRGAS